MSTRTAAKFALQTPLPATHRAGVPMTDELMVEIVAYGEAVARAAQTAPDFKPTGLVHDPYRDEWLNIEDEEGFKLRIKGQDPDFSHTASYTKWLTITPDQARRILAMLSTEASE